VQPCLDLTENGDIGGGGEEGVFQPLARNYEDSEWEPSSAPPSYEE